MTYKIYTWQDVENQVKKIGDGLGNINFTPTGIVAIMKGGMVPARLLADYFGGSVEIFPITCKHYVRDQKKEFTMGVFSSVVQYRNLLIIDDIFDTGKTITEVTRTLQNRKVNKMISATLLYKKSIVAPPSYFGEEIPQDVWAVFPWEAIEMSSALEKKV